MNLSGVCEKYCDKDALWVEVGEDDSYIFFDSNPLDIEDFTIYLSVVDNAIKNINKELGIPGYIYELLSNTTYAQGVQIFRFEDLGIELRWSYHPDKGIEMFYLKI